MPCGASGRNHAQSLAASLQVIAGAKKLSGSAGTAFRLRAASPGKRQQRLFRAVSVRDHVVSLNLAANEMLPPHSVKGFFHRDGPMLRVIFG